MIYFDNAATTYPKPPQVIRAVDEAMRKYGANPGRAGHTMSMETAEELYRCRTAVAEFFHAPGPDCVVFTLNCTQAINFVLKGVLKSGDHVVTSNLEHNAVMRPLVQLEARGVAFTRVPCAGDGSLSVERLAACLTDRTRAVVMTHASNVCGTLLPLGEVGEFCAAHGLAAVCITAAASIDLKAHEPGLLEFCRIHGWPVQFYSAAQLQNAPGQFTPSVFVRSVTGVDNVCERAAVLASGGPLLLKKTAGEGVTAALAAAPFAPGWEEAP